MGTYPIYFLNWGTQDFGSFLHHRFYFMIKSLKEKGLWHFFFQNNFKGRQSQQTYPKLVRSLITLNIVVQVRTAM